MSSCLSSNFAKIMNIKYNFEEKDNTLILYTFQLLQQLLLVTK